MRVLLHICCAPCAIGAFEKLEEMGYEVKGYWYNPNIHPFTEYRRRKEEVEKLFGERTIFDEYDFTEYLRRVVGKENARCPVCYEMRLKRTAEKASEIGADLFTTTLLISPYQNLDLIREIGEDAGKKYGVPFLFLDMRDKFRESHRIAREKGIYMQKYCGCIYSEFERFSKCRGK